MATINSLFDQAQIHETALLNKILSHVHEPHQIFKTRSLCKLWLHLTEELYQRRALDQFPTLVKAETDSWGKHYILNYRGSQCTKLHMESGRFLAVFERTIRFVPAFAAAPNNYIQNIDTDMNLQFSAVNTFSKHSYFLIGNSSEVITFKDNKPFALEKLGTCIGQKSRITAVAWMPETNVITGGSDGCLYFWSLRNTKVLYKLFHEIKDVHSASISCIRVVLWPNSNKKFIMSGSTDGSLTVCFKNSNIKAKKFDSCSFLQSPITTMSVSDELPSENITVFAASNTSESITINEINVEDKKIMTNHIIEYAHATGVNEIQFNSSRLISCGKDQLIKFWNKEATTWVNTKFISLAHMPISFLVSLTSSISYLSSEKEITYVSYQENECSTKETSITKLDNLITFEKND